MNRVVAILTLFALLPAIAFAEPATQPLKLLDPKPLVPGAMVVKLWPEGSPRLRAAPGYDQPEAFKGSGAHVSSITNIASSTWSMNSSKGPEVAITDCDVSSPSTVALMMMSAMIMRSVFGFSTMVRSQAITVFPCVWWRSSDEDARAGF